MVLLIDLQHTHAVMKWKLAVFSCPCSLMICTYKKCNVSKSGPTASYLDASVRGSTDWLHARVSSVPLHPAEAPPPSLCRQGGALLSSPLLSMDVASAVTAVGVEWLHMAEDDDDAGAVYCSSGPHVRSQMRPENAKNEACFPFASYMCVDSYGTLWDGACLRPEQ